MSAETVQLMPRPGRDSEQTDFPAIAFRTTVPDIARDRRAEPDEIGPESRAFSNADRTSSTE